MKEIDNICNLLEKTFNGPAWHGPSVLEALDDVSSKTAFNKIEGSHSVIELVMHMTTWRNFTAKRLSEDNEYEVTDEDNFPNGTDWTDAIASLKQSQVNLIEALKNFPEKKLSDIVPTRKYDFYSMLHGIIQHDIYHTGQIILLKKL
jgi:uncharacterized damage-inducible protein DinB